AGKVDVICNTADVLPVIFPNIMTLEPRVFFQIDWSRGGDAIVVNSSIKSVQDLKGKKVAVAFGTPSQTLLLWVLAAGGLKYSDITVCKAPTAIDAATYFKTGKVDAAVVWNPDDEDCIAAVPGSKILKSTREASNTIADIFYAKDAFIQSHQKELKAFVEGWFKAAAEINTSEEAKAKATKLMATTFNVPEAVMNFNNARFCTYGDNVNFFNLNGTYNGTKGEDLFEKTTSEIPSIALTFQESLPDQSTVPSWRTVINLTILKSISMTDASQAAEVDAQFSPITKTVATAPAFSTKRVSINFPTGVYELCDECRYKIDKEFVEIAKGFARNRIRIEGNTDDVGSLASNVILSKKRAQAVADYLITRYGFDRNRFVIVGNGPNKPVAGNDDEVGRAQNRRTDFELLSE
ncbi:MAG: phosphate ABC transporter substrate-binding/OmpA family protein, partial [Nitrosarchaeum sp.]|nr:phosphate ABC transporter substrate-binding/OmpA family protein [Nitrosarchaeum sp.]